MIRNNDLINKNMFIETCHFFHGVGLLNLTSGIFICPANDENETNEYMKNRICVVSPHHTLLNVFDKIAGQFEPEIYEGTDYNELVSQLKGKGLILMEFDFEVSEETNDQK